MRRQHIVSRAALRIVLARWPRCPPDALQFVADPSGKPRLVGGAPHFSVSHSGDWGLIAVTALGPVGVDIERCVPISELEAIAERVFAPAAARTVMSQRGKRRVQSFYREWTRMEAQLKASGEGLAGGLSRRRRGTRCGGLDVRSDRRRPRAGRRRRRRRRSQLA